MEAIPLSLVQAGRDLTEPRVSPDGSMVAFVQRWRGGTSINAAAFGADRLERQLTHGPDPAAGRGLGGGCFTWVTRSDTDTSFVYVAIDGELWWQDGMHVERLTSHERTARAPTALDRSVVYAVDEAEIRLFDLETGHDLRLDDGRHEFCFDPAIAPDGRTVSWQAWSPPHMAWDGSVRVDLDLRTGTLTEWCPADAAIQQPRFTPHGEPVHVHDASGWLNVHVGDRPIVLEPIEHAGPTWGMGNRTYAFDDEGTRMAFTRNEDGFGALWVVDLTTGAQSEIGRGVHGHLSWVGDHLVAVRTGARTATCIAAYRTDTWTRTTIALSAPDVWPRDALPEPEPVETESSDGELLHARRFVAAGGGGGRMLVWVHGGPTDQWQVDWRPRIVYWWSRGWDVLVVDPRGTTGHGRRYQRALHGCWGRLDVDDTADLIRHAHDAGWADPGTTVVIGGSSGGLTVLGVLADHPDLVSGGVASYPVSDLVALSESTHRFEAHYTDTLVGSSDATTLSPIHRAERITAPLLVFHGSDDPVVPLAQSEALVERVRVAGGSVELVVYGGEGHGFRDPEHVADEYARTEEFLRRVTARDG